ncbi:MAG: DUF459 domain-containing protein, partial [Pseudomonadota bacterium]
MALRLFLCMGLCLAFAFGFSMVSAETSPVWAQQQNFFQRIFGPRKAKKPEVQKKRVVKRASRPRAASKPRRSTTASRAAAASSAVEKVENASVILVAGDFYAGAVARGLDTAFSGDAAVRVVNRFNGNSGIVRDDFYDWTIELGPMIDELSPAAIVFMAGANDRQPIRKDGQTFDKLSQEWSEEYRARIQQISKIASEKRVPLFWLSTPPPRSGVMSRDYLAFNATLDAALAVGFGEYVDVWDKFSTDEGAFTAQGPDVNGQVRRLRTNDGLNFTKAGRRKLAFYVEQPLRSLLAGRSDDVFAAAANEDADNGALEPAEPVGLITRVAPTSLAVLPGDASIADGLDLAGGPVAARAIASGSV